MAAHDTTVRGRQRTWIILELIKSAVLAGMQDSEEKEAAQSRRPCNHKKSNDDLCE